MGGLRPQELLIILVIVLVLFGGKKLPEMARSLGSAQREFRHGLTDTIDDDDEAGGSAAKPGLGQTDDV